MRILLTVHQFLPDHGSGTELIALNTARELMHRGHDVQIFTAHPAKVLLPDEHRFDQYEYAGIRVHRFQHQLIPMGKQTNLIEMEYRNDFFKQWFRAFLQRERPDLVHFIHLYRLSTTAIDACRELGIPTVFTATDFWFICPLVQLRLADGSLCQGPNGVASNCVRHIAEVEPLSDLAKRIRNVSQALLTIGTWAIHHHLLPARECTNSIRAISDRPSYMASKINQIDRVIVPSRIMAEMLQRHGLKRARTIYLPYGINTECIPRRTDRGTAGVLRIGFMGTLTEHKGCHVLIEAVRSLPRSTPVELVIHGKLHEFPEYAARLRALVQDDTRIHFRGAFHSSDVGAVLLQLDIVVCPSLWYENTPLVIYEAMAAGVPVIASNLGGMAESVKKDVNGLLFEPGNAQELAAHLRRLTEDRSLVQRFSASTTMPLSMSGHVTRLEAIYTSLLPTSAGTISTSLSDAKFVHQARAL